MYPGFEAALDAAVSGGRIAGAVALVADRDGEIYARAAGVRSAGGGEAMTRDTLFWIASMTKAVVSVAALQLVERGRLSLDGDLSELLPDLAGLEVFDGFAPDGAPRLRPARGAVTLRLLLTHTSGFGYAFLHTDVAAWMTATGTPDVTSGLRSAHRQPLLFDPGQGWAYGIGIDWVGIAVEVASGQRLDAYLAEHIFAPLGMVDTTFDPSPVQAARKVGMHARGPDGALAPMAFGLPSDVEVLSGGGGLYSTAPDYGRFLRMLLGGGPQLLSAETMAALGTVQTGDRRAGAWTGALPHLSRDFDLYPDMLTGWGLATMISPDASADGRDAGSLAWAGLSNCYYWADPAAGKAGLILTQILPFGDPEVLSLFAALERDVYGITASSG
ncbi:serine hydrolase domain-containing protein [Phenylobacterium sp.]|uniref:serine hydrolase domain-containing protein n=1 Tax=Phenylobacterium sp. TaxID=1871053 RepID=UPI00286C8664|nr:serine hydrolase domain-containing protein [Phenylobacterium sp.]